jgi:hypothetical protein
MKHRLTQRGAQKRAERERQTGIDPEDDAARWLAEHDPAAAPEAPKTSSKSRHLHRWRQQQKKR